MGPIMRIMYVRPVSHAVDVIERRDYTAPMVEREEMTITSADAQRIIAAARIVRGGNGEWTIILDVDGDIRIDEYRHISFTGELRLKGRQRGRRPNPAWGKTPKDVKKKDSKVK
jgi:hypothetical protein